MRIKPLLFLSLIALIFTISQGCSTNSSTNDDAQHNSSQKDPIEENDYYLFLNENYITLNIGETYQLYVKTNSDARDLIWHSDNSSVASVSNKGLVFANSYGGTTISVYSQNGGNTCYCYIEVNSPKDDYYIRLKENHVILGLGETYQLSVETNSDEYAHNLIWHSDNDSIASVSNDGLVFANFYGGTTISVYSQNNENTCYCYIEVMDFSVLTPENVARILGENYKYENSLTIPNSVTSISAYALENCYSLESVTIPSSVTHIGDYAFSGCTYLNAVHIENLEDWLKINFDNPDSNPLKYAKHLYIDGEELQNLVIPSGVTTINPYAFVNCDSLETVRIPSSVTSIKYSAFSDCLNIESVYMENLEHYYTMELESENYALTSAKIVFDDRTNISIKFPESGDTQDLMLESVNNENIVTIYAESGHSSYEWFVNMVKQYGFYENTFSLNTTDMPAGLHSIMVIIDEKYDASMTIEVLR